MSDSQGEKREKTAKGAASLVPAYVGKKVNQREGVAVVAPSYAAKGASEVTYQP